MHAAQTLLPSLLAMSLLAAPGVARAGATAVLRGSAGTAPAPSTTDVAAAAAATLSGGSFEMAGDLADVLALRSAPVWVLGADQTRCTTEALDGAALDALVAKASDAVDMLEFGAARASLAEAERALPCLDTVVDPGTLYKVWFLQGLSAFHEGNEAEARAAFRVATGLDPTRQWSPDYAPAPQGLFLAALQESLTQEGRALGREEALLGDVFVDGEPFDGTGELLAGTHLVQLRADGGVRGILLDLPSGDGWLSMLSPAAVEARIMRADGGVASFVADMLASSGWDEVLLVSELGVARFAIGTQRFLGPPRPPPTAAGPPASPAPQGLETAGTSVARGSAPAPGIVGGAVVTGLGAGAAAAGFVLSGLAYQRGQAVLEASGTQDAYTVAYRDNVGGLGMGIAGAVATGTGILIAALSARDRTRGPSLAAQRRRAQAARTEGAWRP